MRQTRFLLFVPVLCWLAQIGCNQGTIHIADAGIEDLETSTGDVPSNPDEFLSIDRSHQEEGMTSDAAPEEGDVALDDGSMDEQEQGNKPPVAFDSFATTAIDTSANLTLSYADPDNQPGPYTFSIRTNPQHGTLSGSQSLRSYTPNPGYLGQDSFQWSVHDGQDESNIATVTITISEQPQDPEWPMSAANPQRTSWTPEEVRGSLGPVWYRPIEPYIPPYVQLIAANGKIFVSTAKGLYAFDADTGDPCWPKPYATEMPLGNAPTIYNNVAYVGGFDHQLHAVDVFSGEKIWTFDGASAGFDTNPLVANKLVYLGNRDGAFYAIYSNDNEPDKRGTLAWKFQTQGSITFSAALSEAGDVIYFASNDSYAYALDALDGTSKWNPPKKLPGLGFRNWWPVAYQDKIVFVGTSPYRTVAPFGGGGSDLQNLDADEFFYTADCPNGEIGNRTGMQLDASGVAQYLKSKPWRRTYFVLNASDGSEYTFGSGNYAPIAWYGTRAGSRYPPLVNGNDQMIYQSNTFWTDKGAIFGTRGAVSGWQIGTPIITTPRCGSVGSCSQNNTNASDEPMAYSSGGNIIYYNLCCDREAAWFSIDGQDQGNLWSYNLSERLPGYNIMCWGEAESGLNTLFGTFNGVYGGHGDNNAFVPYRGKLFVHRSNAILAFGPNGSAQTPLDIAAAETVQDAGPLLTLEQLQEMLSKEVGKILDAGPLRPAYSISGNADGAMPREFQEAFMDNWHNASDTLFSLSQAYSHITSDDQKASLKTYLQNEFTEFRSQGYPEHRGWNQGAAREPFDLPSEVTQAMEQFGARDTGTAWKYFMFYGLWSYAQLAKEAWNDSSVAGTIVGDFRGFDFPASSDEPFRQNALIGGMQGYIQLATMVNDTAEVNRVQPILDALLQSRAQGFDKDTGNSVDTANDYRHVLSVATNFMFMTPELGDYLREHSMTRVQEAFDEYNRIAPYWFVSQFGSTYAEGAIQPLYDVDAMFQAKALILEQTRQELVKYLDVPATQIGDLFFINRLLLAIEAP